MYDLGQKEGPFGRIEYGIGGLGGVEKIVSRWNICVAIFDCTLSELREETVEEINKNRL
jgi:hypothetical protein